MQTEMNDLNPDVLTLEGYEPQSYWEDVQADGSGVEKVGNVGCGVAFNKWIYKRKLSALRRAFDAAGVEVKDTNVFEAGFGGGFYLPVWLEMGARTVNGIDLSLPAVTRVREQYPTGIWLHGDIADPIGVESQFGIVTCVDVFFHIVDDARWQQAFFNLAELVADGGWFLFTDQTMTGRTTRARHVRRRTQDDYVRFLEKAGFENPMRFTFTRFTGHDVEGGSRIVPHSLAHSVWRCAYNAVRLCPSGSARESVGNAAGSILYRLDERYSSTQVSAPCLELWLCRKGGGT